MPKCPRCVLGFHSPASGLSHHVTGALAVMRRNVAIFGVAVYLFRYQSQMFELPKSVGGVPPM
jgi:hypothetical protein